jgi:tetratricopeptide (TPR) repeat protein
MLSTSFTSHPFSSPSEGQSGPSNVSIEASAEASAIISSDGQPLGPEDVVTVFEGFGRSFFIPKTEWYAGPYLQKLKEEWENADGLYDLLTSAHPDGKLLEHEDAFQQFMKLDGGTDRAKSLKVVWLLESNQEEEALNYVHTALETSPESPILLCHQAEIFEKQGKLEEAKSAFQKALQYQPNHPLPMHRYLNLVVLTEGDDGYLPALAKLAEPEDSWMPRLWLARQALEAKKPDEAFTLYNAILEKASKEPDVLTMISGDLGQAAELDKMICLIGPVYEPTVHGLPTGMNLLNAYFEKQDVEKGQALLKKLFSGVTMVDRPLLMQQADRFDQLRALKRLDTANQAIQSQDNPESINVSVLVINEPIWYYGLRQPNWMMPGFNSAESVGILLFSVLQTNHDGTPELQQEDHLGRLSRSLPLYLLETFRIKTSMKAAALLPVVVGQGPISYGQEWNWQDISQFLKASDQSYKHMVTGALTVLNPDEVEIALTLWDVASASVKQQLKKKTHWDHLAKAISELEASLLLNFQPHWVAPPPFYDAEARKQIIPHYAISMGQLLILFMIEKGMVPIESLWGERRILDYLQDLCLNAETDTFSRMLYLSGLAFDKAIGSDVYEEYINQALILFDGEFPITHPLVLLSPLLLSIFNQKEGVENRLKELQDTGVLKNFPMYEDWVNTLK